MAAINYFMGSGWLPQEYELAMPKELKALGLDIAAKNVPVDDMDADCKTVILHGEGAYRYFGAPLQNETYKLDGKKATVHIWDIPYHRMEHDIGATSSTPIISYLQQYPMTCASTFTKQTLKKLLNIDSEIQLAYFNDTAITDEPVEKVNQIISVGRTAPEKNYISVLYALCMLPQTWDRYLIITPGMGVGQLIKQFATAFNIVVEIKDSIPTKDVMFEIKRSRLMVDVSMFEGFGLPPKEAIWSGTPVIISDIPPFVEHHGNTVPMVNPFDFISLKAKIADVWNNGFDLTEAKKKIEPLTVHNQAVKYIEYLKKQDLL